MNSLLLLTSGLIFATVPTSEVLCERTMFVQKLPGKELATFRQLETTKNQHGLYGLSSVTVPQLGWEVHAVTVFMTARAPEKWIKLGNARLNVVAKKRDLPTPEEDPRRGRQV